MVLKHLLGLAICGAALICGQTAGENKVERGKYLTVEVGKCQECHTPRLENNDLDKEKWMKGAVMNIAPIKPVEGWHKTAPDLTPAGRLWERWGEAGLVKFMTTGQNPRGGKADAPMPTYKLSQADAEAIVAYLKTLP